MRFASYLDKNAMLRINQLITNIHRHRVIYFSSLAVLIVIFSIFGLSNDAIFEIPPSQTETPSLFSDSSFKMDDIQSSPISNIQNLIILPCHSVFAPELNPNFVEGDKKNMFKAAENKENWILEDFQLESNDQISFLKHLELSLFELYSNIENSALVISGGFTKSQVEKSESSSYLELLKSTKVFEQSPNFKLDKNILLEEYARDSYENVLYSIITFYKKFNKFPKRITIVSLIFKRERFLTSHLTTLGYYTLPSLKNDEILLDNLPNNKNVKFVGVGPFLPSQTQDLSDSEYKISNQNFWDSLIKNEKLNALDLFRANPFGSKFSKLNEKKMKRDPWNKHSQVSKFYHSSSEVLNTLIEIDDYDIVQAWNLYQEKVIPYLPLYLNN